HVATHRTYTRCASPRAKNTGDFTMSEQIQILVEQLQEILDAVDWMGRTPRPKLRDPATAEQLAELTKAWGRPLPPSYEAFLKLSNGMEGADQYDWAIAG